MTHALKTWPEFYKEVESGRKPFELRKNDRNFKEGDKVILQEFDPTLKTYTGKEMEFRIGYIITDFGLKSGYIAFTLEHIEVYS